MSIADEARVEAEKRWPNPNWSPVLEAKQRAYTTGYVDGASRKVEAAPSDTRDEVLVEGSYFAVADLPKILGNYMRSSAKHAREAKAHWLKVAELKQMLVELKPAPSDTDHAADVKAWIDQTLALPMYQNAISEYGQGVVETLRQVRKLLDGGMHPDTRAALGGGE